MEATGGGEARCASSRRPGSDAMSAAGTSSGLDARSRHLDRLDRALAADSARRRRVEVAAEPLRVEPRRVDVDGVGGEIVGMRAATGSSPSVRQKPSASSSSCPGVRIVTATGSPPIRISSGSSTATTSVSRRPSGSRTASTSRVEYEGRAAHAVSVLAGRARLSPRVPAAQLAIAQTANTVSDQLPGCPDDLACRRTVDVVVVRDTTA